MQDRDWLHNSLTCSKTDRFVAKVRSELEVCRVSPVLVWKWTVRVSTMPTGKACRFSLLWV